MKLICQNMNKQQDNPKVLKCRQKKFNMQLSWWVSEWVVVKNAIDTFGFEKWNKAHWRLIQTRTHKQNGTVIVMCYTLEV